MSAAGFRVGVEPPLAIGKTRRVVRRAIYAVAGTLVLIGATAGAFYGWTQWGGNLHIVQAGKFYRSAQLSKSGFAEAIKANGIRSILNLRGANPKQQWYEDEVAASAEAGIVHYDYGISARRLITARQIDDILDIIHTAPKPILVHCNAGSDRTGLVSAVYQAKIQGLSVEEADHQLSLAFGHFPYLTSKTVAMDESYWAYVVQP